MKLTKDQISAVQELVLEGVTTWQELEAMNEDELKKFIKSIPQ